MGNLKKLRHLIFSFLESGHYFGTAKKEIVDNQFGTEGVLCLKVCHNTTVIFKRM